MILGPEPVAGADRADGRPTGPPRAQLKPWFPTPGLERSSPEKPPTGLAFEYPRDPEHRSYSDRGEPASEDRGRGDGHTGRCGPGRNWNYSCPRPVAAAGDKTPDIFSSQTSWRC